MLTLCSLLIVAPLSWLLVYRLRSWAEHRQIVDVPNQRSSHSKPTPLGGGLAIVGLALGGLLIYGFRFPSYWGTILPYFAGSALIAGVSLFDDLRSLPTLFRLGTHFLSAVIAIVSFGAWRTVNISGVASVELGWLGVPVTLLWIVGLTNAYNFMDGIDGLAGGQALVAASSWVALGAVTGQPLVSGLGLLLAGTSVGFLCHNWSPARIFLGDVGSAFLGYTFAVLPVIAARADSRIVLAGVMVLWPFAFDSCFTLLRRLLRGENIFAAHRSHLYQRLVMAGRSHSAVSSVYIALAALGAGLAVAYVSEVKALQVSALASLLLLCVSLWSFVVRVERKHNTASPVTVAVVER